ncbi:DUF2498 family protein [Erwiniaceae bacterium BAC15a-03b]|uniref:DUF2498 family protein n=1 Tax=Winslowiella arboricola TaxID=2978220 RepID=A0A9J6PVA8_9GAMM|nr:DUF2498 family protein [Winslowiella arboricola]MCU5775701.1 DUF2498 family protein [Winslowiella arboricola]MCU5779448.1 DUF2498 family protein [Winslowiella arboricola]
MYADTQPIDAAALLVKANALIVEHENYFAGMEATGVEQSGNILVFRGNYFLDEQGLPTSKSTTVFNVFKFLALQLSAQYHLKEE